MCASERETCRTERLREAGQRQKPTRAGTVEVQTNPGCTVGRRRLLRQQYPVKLRTRACMSSGHHVTRLRLIYATLMPKTVDSTVESRVGLISMVKRVCLRYRSMLPRVRARCNATTCSIANKSHCGIRGLLSRNNNIDSVYRQIVHFNSIDRTCSDRPNKLVVKQ